MFSGKYFMHQGLNADYAENMALHSVDEILIENGINCLAIGLPEIIGVPQPNHHEELDQSHIARFTDK